MSHDNLGHLSYKKVCLHMIKRYFWVNMYAETKKYINQCDICKRFNRNQIKYGYLDPRIPPHQMFLMYCADHCGPLNETANGNKHILTVVDFSTRFLFATPTKSTGAKEVIEFFEKLRLKHGCFVELVHDRGSAFTSSSFQNYLKNRNIISTASHAYFHQANGLCERYNRTLQNVLKKITNEKADDWDLQLDNAVFAINITHQTSLVFSPYQLVYGVNPLLLGESKLILNENDLNLVQKIEDQNQSREESIENLLKSQNYQKQYYDKNRNPISFKEDDIVYF